MTTNPTTKNSDSQKPPPPSFVKLAMKNMVRKGNQSILHFALTASGFIVFIIVLAWFARPNLPH